MSVGHGGRDRSSERLTELEHLVSSSRGRKYSEQPDFADDGAPKTTRVAIRTFRRSLPDILNTDSAHVSVLLTIVDDDGGG